jgi:hypothetical protein
MASDAASTYASTSVQHPDKMAPSHGTPFTRVVVWDLDETLVCCESGKTASSSWKGPVNRNDRLLRGDFVLGDRRFYIRPLATQCILHAHRLGFKSVVFTAARQEYAQCIVQNVFEPLGVLPLGVFVHRHCKIKETAKDGSPPQPVSKAGVLHAHYKVKPLRMLVKHGIKVDVSSQCVLVDDKAHSAQQNPHNLLLVPPFHGSQDDRHLERVMTILTALAQSDNLSMTLQTMDPLGLKATVPDKRVDMTQLEG